MQLKPMFPPANCDYTDPLAIFAIKMIQNDLIPSYNGDMDKTRRNA